METKRDEYERAGIAEYWIVDTQNQKVTVLALKDGHYMIHAVAGAGEAFTSVLLAQVSVRVSDLFPSVGDR